MVILRIEHEIPNYDGWKKAFDSDPMNRKKAGVLSYRVSRPVNNPNYVLIDLEFENSDSAGKMLAALQSLWKNVDGKIIFNPKTQILESIENISL